MLTKQKEPPTETNFSPRSSTSAARVTTSTSPTLNGQSQRFNPTQDLIYTSLNRFQHFCCYRSCTSIFSYLPDRYISILVELTRLEGTRHGHLIASQMLDVAIRVKAIRGFAVAQMATLLDNAHLLTGNMQRMGICEVLYAAAWICGEFSEYVDLSHWNVHLITLVYADRWRRCVATCD